MVKYAKIISTMASKLPTVAIIGRANAGKSSLLRVLAGLWNTGTGDIVRPAEPDMLFLPQTPYLPLGDLRCQLLYPNTEREISDEELAQWLERVNLPTLAARFGGLGATLDWAKVLSVGEQQRLEKQHDQADRHHGQRSEEQGAEADAGELAPLPGNGVLDFAIDEQSPGVRGDLGLNAEIEHQTAIDTTTGAPLPIGKRGAVMADSVGPRRGNPAALAFTLKYAEALGDRVLKRRR